MDHFSSSLSAVWKFSKTVYCELLQIILLATLALVMGNLFWHSALLAVIVIVSAIRILFIGYRKLHTNDDETGIADENESSPSENESSPWIKLTGNRLLNIVSILAFGVFVLAESIKNQTMIVTVAAFIGAVITVITMFIGYFRDDHPTTADWFFRKDYNQSVLMALNTLWIICAYVFVALLLLPLGIIGMPDSTIYALEYGGAPIIHAYTTASATISDSGLAIEGMVVGFLMPIMSSRVMLNMHPLKLSNSEWSTTGLKLLEQICNIIFFWGVLWMTLLIWIRSNPEAELHHFIRILYIRCTFDTIVMAFAIQFLLIMFPFFLLLGYVR